MIVPLLDLSAQYEPILKEIKEAINKVIDSNKFILGPEVHEFEDIMKDYLESNFAISCASGTDALILALKGLDIGSGDEVITTPFTFFATAGAIHRVGAKPVFVDIDPDTFNIDPDKIEEKITENTKAIMPVHLYGQPAEMDKILEIAKKHSLKVVEDNAQGVGAKFDDKFAGTFGDVGTLSFFPSKNLGAMGEGGLCLVQNEELAQKIKQLRVHGENPKYFHQYVGINSRLQTIQAAVLKIKIKHLADWSEGRRKNAEIYYKELKDIQQIKLPKIHEKAETLYNQFTVKVNDRDELMEYLKEKNIGCAIYYPRPLHLQECFADLGYKKGDFPESEKVAKEVISLPIYKELTNDQIMYVIDSIKAYYKN